MSKHSSEDPDLDNLIEKYGSGKNISEYNVLYGRLFRSIRSTVTSVLEIGIGSMISDSSNFAGVRQYYPEYTPGGSLRVWRDYFPNATIHGVDIAEDCRVDEDRIKTFIFNSSDFHKCKENLYNYKYDIIIDDGDHSALNQLLTLKNLAPLLKTGGYYFIEDIGGYPGFEEFDGDWYRPALFGEYKEELFRTIDKHNLKMSNNRALTFYKEC